MEAALDTIRFMQDKRLVNSRLIFDGAIIQLYLNELKLDTGQQVERELIHHKPAVAVLAITTAQKVVLVKQYRPAIDQYIYEIPAGILDKGDELTPVTGAQRELEEETAYQAQSWRHLHDFYVSPGFLDEQITLYEATGLTKVANPLPQDDDEDIEVFEFTKEEAQQLIASQQICDLKTLFALQTWLYGSEHI